jgi:hypothetical protein
VFEYHWCYPLLINRGDIGAIIMIDLAGPGPTTKNIVKMYKQQVRERAAVNLELIIFWKLQIAAV